MEIRVWRYWRGEVSKLGDPNVLGVEAFISTAFVQGPWARNKVEEPTEPPMLIQGCLVGVKVSLLNPLTPNGGPQFSLIES